MTDTQSWRPSGTDYPNAPIQVLLGLILNELPPIGKKSRNKEQGYDFRGIDDVMIELNPLLGKYGVVILPDVLSVEREVRTARSGAQGYTVHLHVRFTFMAPDGSTLTCSTRGEGTDYGDKATNKSMTSALKYALFQVFAIADATADSDHSTPEPGAAVGTQDRHDKLAENIVAAKEQGLIPDQEYSALVRDYGKNLWPLPESVLAEAEQKVARLVATNSPAPGTTPVDTGGAQPVAHEKAPESVPAAPGADPNVRPAGVPTGTMLVDDDWVSYGVATIPHLRGELRRRKLDDGGSKKQDLVDRLIEHDARPVQP